MKIIGPVYLKFHLPGPKIDFRDEKFYLFKCSKLLKHSEKHVPDASLKKIAIAVCKVSTSGLFFGVLGLIFRCQLSPKI